MGQVLNVAAYKFVSLDSLDARRRELSRLSRRLRLRGTILLATEGINLFIAGRPEAVRELMAHLQSQDEFADLIGKESYSERQPFRRMLVKLKKEIIAFGVDGIDPARRTSPRIAATELRDWMSEGRDITLLDVRNDFEVEVGTFSTARAIGVDSFRDFPAAAKKLPDDAKRKPLVMFCTGGIRCEKAGPFLEDEGFEEVYQLDGGILKYFEECGADHYSGDCFVFDQRVALKPDLDATSRGLCFACQAILTPEDMRSPSYSEGVSCPYCHRADRLKMSEQIAARHVAIARFTDPLPGSQPYDNVRPFRVPEKYDGANLVDMLDDAFVYIPRDEWENACRLGCLERDGETLDAATIVRARDRLRHIEPQIVEPDVNANIEILWEDEAIVAVNKPAPLPMHPCGRFNRNTLVSILNSVYAPEKLRVAHRLDANTSGVAVLCRRRSVAATLQPQFVGGSVQKTYLAGVGHAPDVDRFSCSEPIGDTPLKAGLRVCDPAGLSAQTDFLVVERFETGGALLQVTPRTGRTNQIRIHLWNYGAPITGDPSYLPGGELGFVQTLPATAPPMQLHAWRLAFDHPTTGERLELEAPPPNWC
ncbi:MAG: pseudouridine synthase, partial [Pirellulaceae bacterium]|nr:pseudouridine synthase [Pirellulaceae bacterium]